MAEKIKELELSPEQKKRVKLFIQAFEEKSASLENGMEKGTMESRMYVLLVNWGLDMAVASKKGSFKSIARVLASVVALTE